MAFNVGDQVHITARILRKNGDYYMVRLNSAMGYETDILIHQGELTELPKPVYLGPVWPNGDPVEYKMECGHAVLTNNRFIEGYVEHVVRTAAVELMDNLDSPVRWTRNGITTEVHKPDLKRDAFTMRQFKPETE